MKHSQLLLQLNVTLAAHTFPRQGGNIVQRIVLQRFIDGQNTSEVRLQLASNRPNTLDEAVQRAINITTAYQMDAMRAPSRTALPSEHFQVAAATATVNDLTLKEH